MDSLSERVAARFFSWGEHIRDSVFFDRLINRGPIGWLRSYLPIRFTALMALAVAVMMVLLSVFVITHVRDGLFRDRLDSVVADSAIRHERVQTAFDQAGITDTDALQELVYEQLSYQLNALSGISGAGVVLLRDPANTSGATINEISDVELRSVISRDLMAKVSGSTGRFWQSVKLPDAYDNQPGIVVGSRITVPIVGDYDLFFIYSLQQEENTVKMLQQIMVAGTAVLLVALIMLILLVSYQTLLPLGQVANKAGEIVEGDLEARVPVRGRDELASLARSFNQMAAYMQRQITDYQELAKLQRRFVSDVSHELRTPLSSIRIASDLVYDRIDEIEDPMMARSLEVLHTQVDRFDELLKDLLEISRIDARSARINPSKVDLRDLVRETIDAYSELADTRGVVVHLFASQEPCVAVIDRVRVQRILRNLLVNALEFGEGHPVEITVASTDSSVAVKVRDYGIGMTDDTASHVFDRFYRADPSRQRKYGGTGLGLAISAEDAHLHGGTLTVLSCPGEGSMFLLVLPLHSGEEILEVPAVMADTRMEVARLEYSLEHPDEVQVTADTDDHDSAVRSEIADSEGGDNAV